MSDPTRPDTPAPREAEPERRNLVDHVAWFCINNRFVVAVVTVFIFFWGLAVVPFDWPLDWLPRNPVPVDAIPDIGENQQIVFTEWPGRSPQDVEDQVSYPLTVALLGVPGVKTVRSFSMFGFSSIYIIFDEGIEFYWSRSRILEKLNSLASGTLPEGVQPALGPDATGLGQIFWYTLEGRDPEGNPAGGWNQQELRSVQDWIVRYALLAAEGVSEAASIGGYVQEYQIDVDPDAMRAHGVMLEDIFMAVQRSNIDVGARELEVNQVEYLIRGRGFLESVSDIEETVVRQTGNVPLRVRDVAHVSTGPAMRRGALDKDGAEAVGGVVVARYGANPLQVIKNVKAKIDEIAGGLPEKPLIDFSTAPRETVAAFAASEGFAGFDGALVNDEAWLDWMRATGRGAWPAWLTLSKVTVVPFYDRTGLIYETLGTLNSALVLQILVTIIVVIVMVRHLRSSLLIASVLPLAVLLTFMAMKQFGVDANIVALSGIAIAIGTMVDMGVILCENMLKHLEGAKPGENRLHIIYRATSEVGSAVVTAVSTTVVSFLPVFTMIGAEGKLFQPLAFTKTFALAASVLVALTIIPTLGYVIIGKRIGVRSLRLAADVLIVIAGAITWMAGVPWAGPVAVALGLLLLAGEFAPPLAYRAGSWCVNLLAAFAVGWLLTAAWMPLGADHTLLENGLFVLGAVGGLLVTVLIFQRIYVPLLRFFLAHKITYLVLPATIILLGLSAWLGAGRTLAFLPESWKQGPVYEKVYHAFPGLGKEFMPSLDEGSFLYMPTTMPHAGISAALDMISYQDQAIAAIPEVENVVGKIGRVESALDPAPIGMVETVINYKPEYALDRNGSRVRYRYDAETEAFERDEHGALIEDPRGRPYRQWRAHIKSPDDIWKEIVDAAQYPGATSAPMLQPIAARLVMLQSGMRAPMGVKVKGPDLETIERVGLEIEALLKEVPGVAPATVIADRIVGKPYLEIDVDREATARYGLDVRGVQDMIEMAIGGERLTTTVEGRERYPVRVRYQRELRDSIEAIDVLPVSLPNGEHIPLSQVASIRYVRGPETIKSEDTFLLGYVLLDKEPGYAEVDVVENAQALLRERLASGAWRLPPGVSYTFAGSYENQLRAQKTLSFVLPLSLFVIFLILYLQFRDTVVTGLIFSGIAVCWAGGFILMWLYGQPWFLDFEVAGVHMRTLFQINPVNLSVAVWVGFLALFGIATDDGVMIATYVKQHLAEAAPKSVAEIREAVVRAGERRIRACLMTTATTVLALLPVLTSTGRGSDIMVPMAIPSFGGMALELFTLFLVPVLYCWVEEARFHGRRAAARLAGKGDEP
ncbi:MAG: efflux RND transporter permease subunit [Candidatus Hydrogenedentes bacterium]|nr:efflux RND transporter permease subunit [Candidatus Hydrogenedentota bacterium]